MNASIMLKSDNLLEFFPLIEYEGKWYDPYAFRSRESDVLVVTLGDSWTWGENILKVNSSPKCWHESNGIYVNQDPDRLDHCYGNLISEKLNADWLNLGIPGQGNFRIAELVAKLADIIPSLLYKNILVICTFTEVGRWYNSDQDIDIDYISWFNNNVKEAKDFDKLLEFLNQVCVEKIKKSLTKFDHVKFLIGTNFVDHLGLEQVPKENLLESPWFRLLGGRLCEFSMCFSFSNFERSIDLVPDHLKIEYKKWLLDTTALLEKSWSMHLNNVRRDYKPNHVRTFHPNEYGHRLWADYILSKLNND